MKRRKWKIFWKILSFIWEIFLIYCDYVGKPINPDSLQLFLLAEWLQLIASMINWRLSWHRLWALVRMPQSTHLNEPKILVMILHKTDYLSIWDICCFKRKVNGIAWMPPIVTKTPKSGSLHQSRLSPPNPIQCNLSMFNAMRIDETLSFW